MNRVLLAGVSVLMMSGAAIAQGAPEITGVLVDAADDNRFFTRLGGTAKHTLSYTGLEPGQEYVLESSLVDANDPEDATEPVVITFTPEEASGEVVVELPVATNPGEVNIDYVAETVLRSGEAEVLRAKGDPKNPEHTIQVHSIQRVTLGEVTDEADGDKRIDGAGGVIVAKVAYANMVEGYAYTVWGQLLSQSGQAIGVFASIPEFAPEGKAGEVELRFEVPEGFEGISVVPSVGFFHKKRVTVRDDGVLVWNEGAANPVMIASDTDLDDPERTIEIGVPFGQAQ